MNRRALIEYFGGIFDIGNVYLLICLLNQIRGEILTDSEVLSQIVSLIALTLSLFYFFYTNWRYYGQLPRFLIFLNLFLCVMTIYGLYYIFSEERIYVTELDDYQLISNRSYLLYIYNSLLPIYAFYHFSKIGWLTEKRISFLLIVFLIVASVHFWISYEHKIIRELVRGSDRDEFTNNVGYIFVFMFPLIILLKKNKMLQYALASYVFYYIIISMKRGAILIGVLCLMYFIYYMWSSSSYRERILFILLSIVAGFVVIDFLSDLYSESLYFQARVDQTLAKDGSGRESFYPRLIDYFLYETSFWEFYFGSGANTSVKINGNYAHNDWLELLVNQGIFGVVLYLIYFMFVFRTVVSLRRNVPQNIWSAFFLLSIILIVKSLFSMSYNNLPIEGTLCFGFCLSIGDSYRKDCMFE